MFINLYTPYKIKVIPNITFIMKLLNTVYFESIDSSSAAFSSKFLINCC